MHILVTRPETEAPRTTRKLEAMGHRVTIAPLLDIVTETPSLDVSGVQGLVITSRNAVHALAAHPQKDELTALPVLAVGKSTAAAARDAGFRVTLEGNAGGADLATLIANGLDPNAGILLHISGEAIAFDLEQALTPAGFTVRRAVVYRSRPASAMPAAVAASLRAGDLDAVLLMSPRTATAWCALVDAAGLSEKAQSLVHLCLSSGVADAVGSLNPSRIEIAVKPNEEEMLALAARLSSSSADSR
ncbi:MAG: uroporphyrinogen-III synthase [Hyphomicrobium sp.]